MYSEQKLLLFNAAALGRGFMYLTVTDAVAGDHSTAPPHFLRGSCNGIYPLAEAVTASRASVTRVFMVSLPCEMRWSDVFRPLVGEFKVDSATALTYRPR